MQENKKAENNFYHNDDTSTIEKKMNLEEKGRDEKWKEKKKYKGRKEKDSVFLLVVYIQINKFTVLCVCGLSHKNWKKKNGRSRSRMFIV